MTEHVYVDKAVELAVVEPIVRRVAIYTDAGSYNGSNGGLSARASYVDLYPSGTLASQCAGPSDVAITVEAGNLPGTVIAVPVVHGVAMCGPMFGGCYVATSDSRFREEVERVLGSRFYGAVALHDRWETWEQYERLSR